ncbi:MAG: YebC/PmpR family DNA-binding transcriptional regulator [Phycisphaerae bacterium]|nr:YebC/PmpR family DNA-binding transcriptional regulator [Phycisphaerae bacterium]
MAGHSKWANIRHRKERQDKKKGKVWSKCSRAIMAAARQGGADISTNLTLRYAIEEAKAANMPKDTIQRAVDKGSGAGGKDDYVEISYEGYGPNGVAILIDALTDNRTRTVNDVRMAFSKNGGNVGNPGSVAYMFQTRGRIYVEAGEEVDQDKLMEVAIEAGAEDVQPPEGDASDEPGVWTILTEPTDMLTVREALEAASLTIADAEVTKIPDTMVDLDADSATKLLRLVDALEDNDDVQKVYHNAEIPDEAYAEA